jgi:hypothetical protein
MSWSMLRSEKVEMMMPCLQAATPALTWGVLSLHQKWEAIDPSLPLDGCEPLSPLRAACRG